MNLGNLVVTREFLNYQMVTVEAAITEKMDAQLPPEKREPKIITRANRELRNLNARLLR